MTTIFISYRRDDCEFVAPTICEKLKDRFGAESVFMDIDDIPLGCDFPTKIDESIGKCKVLLALIGEGWLNARFTQGPLKGQRRLDDPTDLVRIEIASALKNQDILVIPVMVGKVTMTDIGPDLPADLEPLKARSTASFRGGVDRPRDLQAIIERIEALNLPFSQKQNSRWKWVAVITVLIGASVGGAFAFKGKPEPKPKYDGSMVLSLLFRDKWLADNPQVNKAILPLQPGDKIAFEAELEDGAEGYFYVIRIDSDGKASLEYPPRDAAGKVVGEEKPRSKLAGFHNEGDPIVLQKSLDGIQSFVWFVRDRALTTAERGQLDKLLSNLKWKLPQGWENEKIMETWVDGHQRTLRDGPELAGADQPENPKLETGRLCLMLENMKLAQYSRALCYSFKNGRVEHAEAGNK
ncbi:MAG: hypothetical protein JWM11_8010 [Planctomycetaceae bacterium]|nr:hypothetical protein [Planctomycetaceae bacterium]